MLFIVLAIDLEAGRSAILRHHVSEIHDAFRTAILPGSYLAFTTMNQQRSIEDPQQSLPSDSKNNPNSECLPLCNGTWVYQMTVLARRISSRC